MALESGQDEALGHLDEMVMGPWVETFGKKLATEAKSPIYRALGHLLSGGLAGPRAD